MKLNYVSVVKEHQIRMEDCGYIIRAELENKPTAVWFKNFKLIWNNIPEYQKICADPLLKNNEILITVPVGTDISYVIEALKSIIFHIDNSYIIKEEPSMLLSLIKTIIRIIDNQPRIST